MGISWRLAAHLTLLALGSCSYDEMMLSALLVVMVPTPFVNAGGRKSNHLVVSKGRITQLALPLLLLLLSLYPCACRRCRCPRATRTV